MTAPGASPPGSREQLVVVGFGIAAYRFIERLTALGAHDRYDITVIGEEADPAYNRVRLSEWLDRPLPDARAAPRGRGPRDLRPLALASHDWGKARGIRTLLSTTVVSIDRDARTVETARGESIGYDRLVLATGSVPIVPRIEGVDSDGVFVYRTIEDLEALRERASRAKRAVVLGGGLLGIEAAEGLRRLGLAVVLLQRAPHLLNRQFGPDAGTYLETRVRAAGIQPMPGATAVRIEARREALAIELAGKDMPLTTDLAVVAAGVRPRDRLAREAGLIVAFRGGGIVVNDRLHTSDPRIQAIGECASAGRTVYGMAGPTQGMAHTLAEIMAGRSSRFGRQVPATRLRLVDLDIWAIGDTAALAERVTWTRDASYRQLKLRTGQIIAATTIGPWEELGVVQDLIRRRSPIWWWQLRRFRRTGMLFPRSETLPVAEWPSARVVCNCLGVTRGELAAARREGCDSVEAMARRTGASTVCGACRPLLAEFLGTDLVAARRALAPAEARARRPLLATAAAVAALAVAMVAAPPIPPADSVIEAGFLDVLQRDRALKRLTGFALLGATLGTLVLSLRKRWNWMRKGDFAVWRLMHGAVAVLALATLVLHTGLRLGTGLNLALSATFLATSVLGSLAAAGVGRRGARTMFWLHVFAVWPLPVLIAFHILKTWYF